MKKDYTKYKGYTELNVFKKKIQPLPKYKPDKKPCKECNLLKEKMRGRLCSECDNKKKNDHQKKKRAEKWEFLNLDMSQTF